MPPLGRLALWRPAGTLATVQIRTVVLPLMSMLLYRRCALALFAAMLLASGCGLLVLGPIEGPWSGLRHARWMDHAAHAALLAVTLWTLRQLSRHRHAALPCARVWRFGAIAVAAAALLQMLPLPWITEEVRDTLAQTLRGAGCLWLVLGFLAERVSARAASTAGSALAMTVAMAAFAWWLHDRDASLLIWMELTPVLLLPSGLPHLPGRITRPVDWWVLVLSYAAGQVGHAVTGPGSIRVWSLCFGLAATYGTLGYRVSARCGSGGDSDAEREAAGPSQRRTSLNTSS